MKITAKIVALLCLLISTSVMAADWPTYMSDNRRSGITDEALDSAALKELWQIRSQVAPLPAWAGPARWDAFATVTDLKSMRNFDPVFHVTVAGDSLFYGSSSQEFVRCLDSGSGSVRWTFFANGAVRVAPAIADGRVYFGADDGYVYCLDAASGKEIWRFKAALSDTLLPSNRKLISRHPVRTGVVVQDGVAYFAASLMPWEQSAIYAVNAANGDLIYKKSGSGMTLQAPFLASDTRLYMPQGRNAPAVFNIADGSYEGSIAGGNGGVYCLLTEDEKVVLGHGNKTGWLAESDAHSKDEVARVNGGNLMLVRDGIGYMQKGSVLTAMPRNGASAIWSIQCEQRCAMIMAGDRLYLGGGNEVVVYDAASGSEVARLDVDGRAYGLAVADGKLFVSTDRGTIYAFGAAEK